MSSCSGCSVKQHQFEPCTLLQTATQNDLVFITAQQIGKTGTQGGGNDVKSSVFFSLKKGKIKQALKFLFLK